MVWAHNKINRTCKDDPIGHGASREKKRQTEAEMGRQSFRMDRIRAERLRTKRNGENWLTNHP